MKNKQLYLIKREEAGIFLYDFNKVIEPFKSDRASHIVFVKKINESILHRSRHVERRHKKVHLSCTLEQ